MSFGLWFFLDKIFEKRQISILYSVVQSDSFNNIHINRDWLYIFYDVNKVGLISNSFLSFPGQEQFVFCDGIRSRGWSDVKTNSW